MVITRQSSSSNAARDHARETANAAIIGARYVNNGMLNPPPKILPLIVSSSRLGIDMSGWIGPGRVNEHTELNPWLGAQTQHLHYTSDKKRRWSNHESFCQTEAVPRKMGASIPRLKVRFSVFICGRGSCIRGSHSPRASVAWSNSPALRSCRKY